MVNRATLPFKQTGQRKKASTRFACRASRPTALSRGDALRRLHSELPPAAIVPFATILRAAVFVRVRFSVYCMYVYVKID